ncbi:MAG: hypothetical protein ACRD3N_09735 [Terracidiphilus sp.]
MSERLRAEFEKYLGRYGLKPRKLPSRQDREAAQRSVTRIKYEEAKSHRDPMAESILIAYEKNRGRYLAETRHPATIAIEEAAAEVEASIRALPAFAGRFRDEVFVGEFPTGSINCQAVKVDGGYLVLVNSGTLMMLQQVVTFLWHGDAAHPTAPANQQVTDGIAEVLVNYVEHGDPFYGPKPLIGGMLAVASSLMGAAAMKFVVAHEYGHILAGHLAEPDAKPLALETEVGAVEVVGKNHAQEFEADDIGYRLTLGVAANEDFDVAVIDAGDSGDLDAVHTAIRQRCLIAAPFVPLTVDVILGKFVDAARSAGSRPASPDSHPPAAERIERLLARCPGKGPRHTGFINLPFMLLPSIERIVKVMSDRLFRPPAPAAAKDNDEARDRAGAEWFDDIMRCVDAIRSGDNATAALILTDAFEKQRTIFEPDVDVVRRALVRAALGRTTDIGRTLLDRQHDRRTSEQYVESAGRSPLASFAGLLPGQPRSSLAGLADLVPDEEPKGLGLVKAVMEEKANQQGSSRAEVHLLDAVLSVWSGERERALSSFEAALAAGIADPSGRLARFVVLEKCALELGVQLDIQKLLVALGLKALGEKGAARELAGLVKAYAEYLGIPLGPVAQRMVEVHLERDTP